MKKGIVFFCFLVNIICSYSQELKFEIIKIDDNFIVLNVTPTTTNNLKKDIQEKKDKYYKVKKGENLISIARNNHIDWRILKKINQLKNITDIYPGQTIKVSYNIGEQNEN